MPAKQSAPLMHRLASLKGAAVLAPAILIVGASLAIGQTTPPADTAAPAAASAPATTQSTAPGGTAFTPAQRKELESIIKDVLLANPEIMLEVQNALEAKMDKIQTERMAVAIKEHADELYRPAASPVVGNAKGDVPVTLDAKTEITRGDHPAQAADLKAGVRVVVDVPEGSKTNVAHSVKIGAAAKAGTATATEHDGHK